MSSRREPPRQAEPETSQRAITPATDLVKLKLRFEAVARLLEAAGFEVSCGVGAPATEEEIAALIAQPAEGEDDGADEISGADLPNLFLENARVLDGASLRWESPEQRSSGSIDINNLQEVKAGAGPAEVGTAWRVFDGTRIAILVLDDGVDGIGLIDGDDGLARASGLSLLQVANIALDYLGVENWELATFADSEGSETEVARLQEARERARVAWTLCGAQPPV